MSPRTRGARIEIVVEEPLWRKDAAALRLIRRAARLALEEGVADPSPKSSSRLRSKKISTLPQGVGGVAILLSNDPRLRALNRKFRGKSKITNVLSFPSADAAYLGDIALAYGRVAGEARKQAKSFAAHAAHLTVHGVLHLLGHDHERRSETKAMETLEIRLMAELSLDNPYELPPLPGRKKAP